MAETVRGKPFGIPVEEFTKEVCLLRTHVTSRAHLTTLVQTMAKLLAGEDQIAVGLSNIAFNSWEQQRQQAFRGVVEMMRKGGF
jgi:hypothetical protein